jgi:enterochelin esterase-like enzyme
MKRAFFIIVGLLILPACVLALDSPSMPEPGYDQGGRFPAGTINTVDYWSPSMGAMNTMWVYTPPGYNPGQRYPVVYGYPGIDAGADTIFADWGAGAGIVADNLIGEGKIQPLIIVAIDDNHGDVASDTLNVIIPYIDSHYSTYADADHRGLYGYSWGGGYTFNIGCSNLDTFHHLSPSSAAPNKAGDDQLFPRGGAEAREKLKTLLISCGDADWLGLFNLSEGTHNYCAANGIPHHWWPVAGGGHDAGVWRAAMWNFLQLINWGGDTPPPPPPVPGDGVVFYQEFNYGGAAGQALGEGSYTLSQLAAKGVINDWASSVRVPSGYTVTMYQHDDFTGESWTLTSDTPEFGSLGADNLVSSVQIEVNKTLGGVYKIMSRHSGKAIDALGAGDDNGNQLVQWLYSGGENQQWLVTDEGGGEYSIIGVHSGKCLDIDGGVTTGGAAVQLSDYWGGTNQKYYITPTDSGYYRISPTHAPDACLDVKGYSFDDGAPIILWPCWGGENQQWSFENP